MNNGNVLIIKVPKWMSVLHGKQWKQWLNLLTQRECLYYTAKINGLILRKVMTNIWPRGGTIISSALMNEMAEKHKGMFGK